MESCKIYNCEIHPELSFSRGRDMRTEGTTLPWENFSRPNGQEQCTLAAPEPDSHFAIIESFSPTKIKK